MACFTTEYVLQIPAPYVQFFGGSCQVGDDIWVVRYKYPANVDMWRFDTKTKQCEKIEHDDRNLGKFAEELHGFEGFIFPSNGKLHMFSYSSPDSRLLEYDIPTHEWKILMILEAQYPSRGFAMLGREFYKAEDNEMMQITNMDTFKTTTIDFPRGQRNKIQKNIIICELNGSIYLIGIKRPYWRSVYQYDKDGSIFVDIKKKDRMDWACQLFGNHLPRMEIFVWSNNNKIYQAFQIYKFDIELQKKDYLQLVIDCFDVDTEQWHTVFQSKFEKQVTNVFGDSDNNVYVISDKTMYCLITEIDLDPNLGTKSLVQLADTNVANYYTEKYQPLTMKLPIGLRSRYDSMITWKLQETRLGQLEHIFNLIEKWEVNMNEIGGTQADLLSEQEKIELKADWEETGNAQTRASGKFEKLKKEYELMLNQQRKFLVDEQILRQLEYRSGRFEELCQRFENWRKRERTIPVLPIFRTPSPEITESGIFSFFDTPLPLRMDL